MNIFIFFVWVVFDLEISSQGSFVHLGKKMVCN